MAKLGPTDPETREAVKKIVEAKNPTTMSPHSNSSKARSGLGY
jgi:hypothetical protein